VKPVRLVSLVALPLALLACGAAAAPTFAQEGTPAAALPVTPDPVECVAEIVPRSLDEIVAFAAQATPIATVATAVAVPIGEPADEATVAAIAATVRVELACVHAGDFLRNASFYTDDALRRLFASESIPEEELRAFFGSPPAPLPAEARTTILTVTDAMVLGDGRVGAFFVFADPGVPPVTNFLLFVEEGDRWLVDDGLTFAPDPAAVPGTPAA